LLGKLAELEEFYTAESKQLVFDGAIYLNERDVLNLKIHDDENKAFALYIRTDQMVDLAIYRAKQILREGEDIGLLELEEINLVDLLNMPYPQGMRQIDTNNYHPISRSYIENHLDRIDSKRNSPNEERQFYRATERLGRQGLPTDAVVAIYKHSKRFWGIP